MSFIEEYLIKYGFIYPTNEIYGRLQNLWDYGHLGALLKENIKKLWHDFFITKSENVFLLDCPIFSSENVWIASGHIKNFHDVLIDCKNCKKRFREDHIIDKKCPSCKKNDWTSPKNFNLMYKADQYYLRPETAQSIFINFKNIINSTGAKIPFSVAQIGKAFRNEITTQSSIFRTREFEQMELENFVFPENADNEFEKLLEKMMFFLISEIQIKKESIKQIEITKDERAHYSKKSVDIFFKFEHGWSELWGLANRSDFDILSHQEKSKMSLHYFKQDTQEKIIPFVLEHSIGLNRLMLAVITDAYTNETKENDSREVLKINPKLAPYKFAILPLTKHETEKAKIIYQILQKRNISVIFDEKSSIGKRYRKQDAIGTPFCITIDSKAIINNEKATNLTIRFRDTKKQELIDLNSLEKYIHEIWGH